jgi:uncharacterized Zn finger protein (UPF0148 family)
MVPEILHRCPACGVSIREFGEGVLFCPECGKPLASKETKTNTRDRAAKTDADGAAVASAPAAAATHTETDKSDTRSTANKPASGADGPMHMARERTRETLHRASNVARGAIEDNVKRVEKIHHVSSVMLEEATYDPSLRFVLVALGLFVLFVILLVLSKVMG